jgi:hypothetical protein
MTEQAIDFGLDTYGNPKLIRMGNLDDARTPPHEEA